jgi:hypothetical protein
MKYIYRNKGKINHEINTHEQHNATKYEKTQKY